MRRPSRREEVILGLYGATLDPCTWAHAVAALSGLVAGVGGIFSIWGKQSRSFLFLGMSDFLPLKAEAQYRDRYGVDDPLRELLDRKAPGEWTKLCLDADSAVSGGLFYRRWFAARGIRHLVAARVLDSAERSAYVCLCRSAEQGAFGKRDLADLKTIMPHLANAAALAARLRHFSLTLRALQATSQRRPAFLVTNAAGRILDWNDLAQEVLGEGDGILSQHGQLAARRRFETATLLQCVAAAARDPQPPAAAPRRHMIVGRPSGRPPYIVTVTKLRASGLFSARLDEPLALIYVTSPEHVAEIREDDLRQLFALTPAEARLTMALARGGRLQQIAAEAGLKMPTIRTQLASVLRKLDVKRQSDIVRVVLSIPCIDLGRAHDASDDRRAER